MTGYKPSFSAHSYGYELSNEPKSVLKLLDFRFGPYCRTASWVLNPESSREILKLKEGLAFSAPYFLWVQLRFFEKLIQTY